MGWEDASSRWVTDIVGAGVVVSAHYRGARHARAVPAHIAGRTEASVVAEDGVVGMDAAARWIAGVVGARIPVVARRRRSPVALPHAAGISGRARIAIVARNRVVGMGAAGRRIAGVVRAPISVVARRCLSSDASSPVADITVRTEIPVVTRIGVGSEDAPGRRVACVVGAGILVGAIAQPFSSAKASLADFVRRAGVAVIAGRRVVGVDTSSRRIAPIVGAGIRVVAVG